GCTAVELRSADFSPLRSGPPKTAGSGLKSALHFCRNSLNSMAVGSGGSDASSLCPGERARARFPRYKAASCAREPTPDPSQEGNCPGADKRPLPSSEESGLDRFMGKGNCAAPSARPARVRSMKATKVSMHSRVLAGSAACATGFLIAAKTEDFRSWLRA